METPFEQTPSPSSLTAPLSTDSEWTSRSNPAIFLIADIVHIIISHLPGDLTQLETLKHLAGYARVCTVWRDIALRELWGTRGSWKHIFPLLGPMRNNSSGKKEYERLPDPASIDRFRNYSRYIREIVMFDQHGLDLSAWLILASLRHQFVLFPSLTALQFQTGEAGEQTALQSFTLMHKDISALSIIIPQTSTEQYVPFLSLLPMAVPNLAFFRLQMHLPEGYEAAVAESLTKMTELRRVSFPTKWQAAAILHALGTLPQLRYVSLISKADLDTRESNRIDYTALKMPLKDLPPQPLFRTLQRLQLATTLINFELLARTVFHESPLETLFLKVPQGTQAKDPLLRKVVGLISKFHLLNCFQIAFIDRKVSDQPFSFESFQTLEKCANLEVFTLYGGIHTTINENSLLGLTSHWPNLTHLSFEFSLALSLSHPDANLIPLSTLGLMAQYLPRLELLYIYLSSKVDDLGDCHDCFPRLTTLAIGWSLMLPQPDAARAVSRYLSALLPNKDCVIKHFELKQLTPPPGTTKEEWEMLSDRREEVLREVNRLVPLLRSVREEERTMMTRRTMMVRSPGTTPLRRPYSNFEYSS